MNARRVSIAARIGADIRRLLELDLHLCAAPEVHAQRNRAADVVQWYTIERTPATLKMSEKPRKYHFFPKPVDIYATKQFHWFSAFLIRDP